MSEDEVCGIRVASRKDVMSGIVKAASGGLLAKMRYHKINARRHTREVKDYTVVPLDCGMSKDGRNIVLYAEDFGQEGHRQVKMFFLRQIEEFVPTDRQVRPSFDIKVDRIMRFTGVGRNMEDAGNEQE